MTNKIIKLEIDEEDYKKLISLMDKTNDKLYLVDGIYNDNWYSRAYGVKLIKDEKI
jgi:hypothetical protein